jgi:hypothetical protein
LLPSHSSSFHFRILSKAFQFHLSFYFYTCLHWPNSSSFQFFWLVFVINRSNAEVNIVSLSIIILLLQHKGVLKFSMLPLNFLINWDYVYFSNKLIDRLF